MATTYRLRTRLDERLKWPMILTTRVQPVFYSWPSQANWYQYRLDRKNIELSVPQIKSFLIELAERSGAESINLVAHSMGSVGLTEALAEIEAQGQHRHFNQVVLAAPDIDADIFRTRIAPSIVEKANRCTLYASSSDLALVASKYFNAGSRAGDTENVSQDFSGIDVIDATNADTSFLGHSYYGNNHVLKDLSELLLDRPANRRTWLRSASTNGRNYWEFRGGQLAERVDGSPLVR